MEGILGMVGLVRPYYMEDLWKNPQKPQNPEKPQNPQFLVLYQHLNFAPTREFLFFFRGSPDEQLCQKSLGRPLLSALISRERVKIMIFRGCGGV